MKIALVDDEQAYLEEIERICREFTEENQIEAEIFGFGDGDSFLCCGKEFSIVFMDIYMNGSNGVLTAKKLRSKDSGCILIFMTTSAEHMPEAFSCHAFEYILKPFSPQRVKEVLKDAMKMLPAPEGYAELYCDRKNIRVPFGNIVSAITDAHYIEIILSEGRTLRCRMTMGQFSEQIKEEQRFILINKGIIANADYITDFDNSCCIMENGQRLPVRIRDRISIEQTVRDYNFKKIRKRQRYGKEESLWLRKNG